MRQSVFRCKYKEQAVQNNEHFVYTEEQLMARLKFFIGVCLALTLIGIVFVVLFSLIFVTQPLNAISPIDQKFFELIVPIATFLTGTLSGIMLAGSKPEDKEAMLAAQKQATETFKTTMEEVKKTPQPNPAPIATTNSWASTPLGGNNQSMNSNFGSTPFGGPVSPIPSWGTTNIPTTASGKKIVPEEEQPLR